MAADHVVATGAPAARTDWKALARRAWRTRFSGQSALLAFLVVVSVPIILPYFWMVVISFTARTGGVGERRAVDRLRGDRAGRSGLQRRPHVGRRHGDCGSSPASFCSRSPGRCSWRWSANGCISTISASCGAPISSRRLRSKATSGAQFPSVWMAFRNSLALAVSQTVIILTVASLAGYYISRFAFRGRNAFLQGMLVLHAFPAMTLIIPIFLMLHWIGLLDTIVGVMLVLATIELPFYVFVMKGFFDGVPWDIEMSAMTDGATRRQAFRLVVLPQVRVGLIAVAVFAFIRAWEEYIFVRTLLIENTNWVMSLYLFWVADDIMGVDYGIVAAVAVFYVLPSLLLYVFCQKYLTQMTIGGIKG